jgi:hypothetical protein
MALVVAVAVVVPLTMLSAARADDMGGRNNHNRNRNNHNRNNHKNNNGSKKYIVRYICPEWKTRTYKPGENNDYRGAYDRARRAMLKLQAIGCEAEISAYHWEVTVRYRLTSERSHIFTDLAVAKLKARQLQSLGFEVHLQEYKGQ